MFETYHSFYKNSKKATTKLSKDARSPLNKPVLKAASPKIRNQKSKPRKTVDKTAEE
jgi:hypothetical protein